MLLAVVKLVASVVGIMALGLGLAYLASRYIKKPSTRLFADGYILTHPQRPAMAFDSAKKANEFAERARVQGVIFEIYGVFRGGIVHCGTTKNTVIS